ncbi:hypothetical protein NLG97_g6349 [Lecanicillium saksenae]|uniref:Uncharacterized protein n=1 Tax=Lecanicillium saksenae TaxID=468837 RepID=A0ACC1QSF8_9HYPO|nr:hypothetical protein NLG97_g6349 [Lecanicillium saksenae]
MVTRIALSTTGSLFRLGPLAPTKNYADALDRHASAHVITVSAIHRVVAFSTPSYASESPACSSPRSSRPIAIELPNSKKSNTSVYTPTETLSARGDLPGGYFPMHEDPKCRIHRTHPFHSENRQKNSEPKSDMQAPREPAPSTAPAWQGAHTPVSSYMPSGLHDQPLPVGKYYPSNYERRTRQLQNQRSFVSESVTSYAKTDAHGTTYKGKDDARQRLQQYQRDMVAQASMALGGSYKPSMMPGNAAALRNLPVPDARFGRPATPQRPISPQLLPMGSPGPVTPMELEAQEEYITGKAIAKENLAPPVNEFAPHSL